MTRCAGSVGASESESLWIINRDLRSERTTNRVEELFELSGWDKAR
jgi:hypothetical protein